MGNCPDCSGVRPHRCPGCCHTCLLHGRHLSPPELIQDLFQFMVKKVLIFSNYVRTTKSDSASGTTKQIGDWISLDKVHTPLMFLFLSEFIFALKFVIHSFITALI